MDHTQHEFIEPTIAMIIVACIIIIPITIMLYAIAWDIIKEVFKLK